MLEFQGLLEQLLGSIEVAGAQQESARAGGEETRTAETLRALETAIEADDDAPVAPPVSIDDGGLSEQEIVELEVVWPAGAGRQLFPDVPLDARVRVREGVDRLE